MRGGICIQTDLENLTIGDRQLLNGKRVVHTDLAEEVRQRLVVSFNFFKGEWYLNLDEGTPWLAVMGVKGGEDDLKILIARVVTTTEGVASLESLTLTPTDDRGATVDFTARLIDGRPLSFAAYVVTPP